MRRAKRSSSLPRYARDPTAPAPGRAWSRRKRTWTIVGIVVLLYWLLVRRGRSADDGSMTGPINWSRYAYSLYATDSASLCHAVMLLDALARFGSKADRVLFYPEYWDTEVENGNDRDSQLLVMARDRYRAKLQPVPLLSVEGLESVDDKKPTWDKSVTKLLAFGLVQYARVIALDSDVSLLRPLDDLFHLPPAPVAMPRAYWSEERPQPLTSLLVVLQPNARTLDDFKMEMRAGRRQMGATAATTAPGRSATSSVGQDVRAAAPRPKFDMELLNERYAGHALVLPHRRYALLTGEFRRREHSAYLGPDAAADYEGEVWDADAALAEAKLVHFSDWPLPKPWVMWPHEGLVEMQPRCGGDGGTGQGDAASCRERNVWKDLYGDFRQRRKDVCRYLSVPAPDWDKIKSEVQQ